MPQAIPGRGDLVVIDFNPQAGHEQAGRRIAIVLTPKSFNKATGFIAVCPITNQKKYYPFEVDLPKEGISPDDDGMPITGVILSDQIKSLDWTARKLRILKHYHSEAAQAELLDDIIEECLAKIGTFLT
jgi:mRNA interferase MazF